MRPSFRSAVKPLKVSMIQVQTPQDCIEYIRNSIYDGADAFGIQLCRIKKEYFTEENLKQIFSFAEDKPVYVTNYRIHENSGLSEEERARGLMTALECGATLLDVTGDMFGPPADRELSTDKSVINRQREFIKNIHAQGGEALMSSHVYRFLPADEVLSMALEMQERGADVAKIVTASESEIQLMKNLETTLVLKEKLSIPFLFLSVGPYCKPHRVFGPYFGSCMWLCVQRYDKFCTVDQPLLRAVAAVEANVDIKPNIRPKV